MQIILGSVKVGVWSPFGEELLNRLTVCSFCIMFICDLSYFLLGYRGQDFGSCFISSRSLLTFYFLCVLKFGNMLHFSINLNKVIIYNREGIYALDTT